MVGTMPCLTAWSASSRGVQAATGRPASGGGVQAKLMIWTICSAVKVSGAPERGASASTSAIACCRSALSASAAARRDSAATQRARHLRTVLGEQWSRRARGSFRWPAAAARTIRVRKATACGQECCRSRPSRIACCGGETVRANGSGPATARTFHTPTTRAGRFPSARDSTTTHYGLMPSCTSNSSPGVGDPYGLRWDHDKEGG